MGEAILIVDDYLTDLGPVHLALKNAGYEVHATAGSRQAIEILKFFHPNLILIDNRLPGMDRLELTRSLKSDRTTRDIVVAALDASAAKEGEEKAWDAGDESAIARPADTRELPVLVQQLLENAERKNPGRRRVEQSPGADKR
jgi:CheY-like chemotaxis protein